MAVAGAGWANGVVAINGCRETRPYSGCNAMGVGMWAIAPKTYGRSQRRGGFRGNIRPIR